MGFASFHYEPHMNPMMSRKKRRIDLGSCVLSPACMHSTHLARQGRGLEHSSTHIHRHTSCDQRIVLLREQIHPFRLHLLSLVLW